MAVREPQGPYSPGSTVTFGPFVKGVNNVDRSRTLGDDELVSAVNFDINRDGVLTRREGSALAVAATGAHSLWARDPATAFYAAGENLYMLAETAAGGVASSTVRTGGLQVERPVSYVAVNQSVYYSNGLVTGMIRSDNTNHPWGVERPLRQPVLTRAAGSLPAGWYSVAIQYINDLGETGGMLQTVSINVVADSSIVVSSIPAPVSADVTYISVYVTEQNGDVLYRYGDDYPVGTTSVTIHRSAATGGHVADLLSDVMPPSDVLEYYNGRIYGAKGSLISYTNALAYGQHNRRGNFIMMPRAVTMMKAVDDGLYVGTDAEVVFFAGSDPAKFARKLVSPYGAVPGTGVVFPKTEKAPLTVGWIGERGFVKGYSGGQTEIGDKERAMIGMFSHGAAMYREQNGIRQVVSTMRGGVRSGMVSSDYAEAEVRRNGVLI